MNNYQKIWEKVLKLVKDNTTLISYNTWFAPTSIREIDKEIKIVYLESEDDFAVDILKKRYLQLLESSFNSVME